MQQPPLSCVELAVWTECHLLAVRRAAGAISAAGGRAGGPRPAGDADAVAALRYLSGELARLAADVARQLAELAPPPRGALNLAPPLPPPAAAAGLQAVALAEGVSLEARVVPPGLSDPRAIRAAVATPELYYIPQWDHFAVRCGPLVFHGNIGPVFPGRRGARIEECRHGARCPSLGGGGGPPCAYFHDPASCPGSRDVRAFAAGSWAYAPALAARPPGGRRLGGRDALRDDLRAATAKEARRHVAQTAHDILCSLVLAKYVLGGPVFDAA